MHIEKKQQILARYRSIVIGKFDSLVCSDSFLAITLSVVKYYTVTAEPYIEMDKFLQLNFPRKLFKSVKRSIVLK